MIYDGLHRHRSYRRAAAAAEPRITYTVFRVSAKVSQGTSANPWDRKGKRQRTEAAILVPNLL